MTDGAVDVFDATAHDALNVVMVVGRNRQFVECTVTIGQADAANNVSGNEVAENIVHGGQGNARNVFAHEGEDNIGAGMRMFGQGAIHRDPLGGHT